METSFNTLPCLSNFPNLETERLCIPHLDAVNLVYARAPRVNFTYASAPLVANVYPSPSCKEEGAEVTYRNL